MVNNLLKMSVFAQIYLTLSYKMKHNGKYIRKVFGIIWRKYR